MRAQPAWALLKPKAVLAKLGLVSFGLHMRGCSVWRWLSTQARQGVCYSNEGIGTSWAKLRFLKGWSVGMRLFGDRTALPPCHLYPDPWGRKAKAEMQNNLHSSLRSTQASCIRAVSLWVNGSIWVWIFFGKGLGLPDAELQQILSSSVAQLRGSSAYLGKLRGVRWMLQIQIHFQQHI